jgi:probable phosphoglycerate mutase
MANTTSTRLCLVRHGETPWNSQKRIQGHIDIDLNATGEAQARALGRSLSGHRFAAVYSSDLRRAWHTAQIATAALGLTVSRAPILRERHFGVLQGITSLEASEQEPHAHRHHLARTPDYDFENGESLVEFSLRVMAGLEHIAARHAGGEVLAFSHGGVLDVAYRAATGMTLDTPRDFTLPNAALNWLEHCNGAWRVISWADSSHLKQSLDELAG